MIRSALIALGLSASGLGAGTAGAQGFSLPTSNIVDTCGGVRVTLDPVLVEDMDDTEGLVRSGDRISMRVGAVFGGAFDYTTVSGGQIKVHVPEAFLRLDHDVDALMASMTSQSDVGFYDVVGQYDSQAQADAALKDGQIALPHMDEPFSFFVVPDVPVIDGDMFADAQPAFDMNNRPAVTFRFTDAGAEVFARYTGANIGKPFAIVLDGEVVSAPTIRDMITGGSGIVTGAFSVDDTNRLAMTLRSGTLPFELVIVDQTNIDGSDPSADFCP